MAAGALARLGAMQGALADTGGSRAPLVIAQAGGAGGTVGNLDKSLSGGENSAPLTGVVPRAAPPAVREARHPAPRANAFDGTSASSTAGETCFERSSGFATISNGHIAGTRFTGTITSGGAVRMIYAGFGMTAVATDHLSGNNGSGRFARSDGCVGRWSAVRK